MRFLTRFAFVNGHVARHQLCAKYCQKAATLPVDKNSLSKLRKQTGFAFSNCRKALVLHDNDVDKALEWLNEEAAKEGWAKANKLQSRPMSQGVIGMIASSNKALLLQVNCETDFVARNVQYLEFVSFLTNTCYDKLQSHRDSKLILETTELGSMMLNSVESVADAVARQVGTLGENISATRAIYMSAISGDSYLGNYMHTTGVNPKYLEIEGCKFGKFSALVRLMGDIDSADIGLHGSELAQHIVGMNPETLGLPEDDKGAPQSEELSRAEGDSVECAKEEGLEEAASADEAADETRLLHQEFLLDPDYTVQQWLEERGLTVSDYVRAAVSDGS
ncbi:elongation factor Ts, mitochondrial-like [Watersipora subatra]|uniref:elongation factor Ts, mitochondrial-like n=1 Tax=Watersipora subatra TaxID=2589382 RepID=UPI00355C89E6